MLRVTVINHTDAPMLVDWDDVTLSQRNRWTLHLRPTHDLGWIPAKQTLTAELGPFGLADSGVQARTRDGESYLLTLPLTVRNEPERHAFRFTLHASAIREAR